jgi:hypothetical protein
MEETDGRGVPAAGAPRAAGLSPPLARGLLVLALGCGLALTAREVLQMPGDAALPAAAVARVGDELILRDEWLRAVAAVASERRTPLTDADQLAILDRLIDQSLLVQHGIDLGLLSRDPRLRGPLIAEVMQVAGDAGVGEPTRAELQAYHAAHPERFQPPPRLRVAAWRVLPDGRQRPWQPPVPDALLPASRLQEWLGPSLTRAALDLPVGEARAVATAEGGTALLQVIERELSPPGAFEDQLDRVRREWQREAEEQAVRELLSSLRQQYAVQRAP